MKKNVGKADRIVRVIVGLVGLALGASVSPWFYIVAGLGLGTALVGYCPAYSLLGMSTCPAHQEPMASEASKEDEGQM